MKQEKTTFQCVLQVVSPLHLGCGEVYEPTCFTIDEQNDEMTVFDPALFIRDMEENDRKRFSEICCKGTVASIIELYKFLRNKSPEGRTIKLCNALVEHYLTVLSLGTDERRILQELNQFQIGRTAFRSSDERPYIPGSAIKGALRTAYANLLSGKKNISKDSRRKGQDLEKLLFEYSPGNTETDPFRLVKISDFQPAGKVATRIVYAVNKKKKPTDKQPKGLAHIIEIIEPGALFTGTVTVEHALDNSPVKRPIVLETLLAGAVEFFKSENTREISELKGAGIDGMSATSNGSEVPLRIGRHSGAESLTISGHRNIKINIGKGKVPPYLDRATTIWLASETKNNQHNKGLRPFGWVKLMQLSQDLEKKALDYEKDFRMDREIEARKKQEAIRDARELKEQQQKEEQEKQREAEQKAAEEAARQAELASMTPEDREIYDLQQPDVSEEKINIAFKKIDEFSQDNQKAAAIVIKAYWQANGKWTKKDFSTKQWKVAREKIEKINSILGE